MSDEAAAFIDTNILVYAFDSTNPPRQEPGGGLHLFSSSAARATDAPAVP